MGEGFENIDLLALALMYRRVPLAHQERLAAIATLPEDMNRLLRLANGAAEALAVAARQTGAEASEIRGAAWFLLQQLCFARDASGDLARLMALFDAQARGGSGQDRDRLRRDYAQFFDATQSRRLRLTPVRWSSRGTTADGTAHYPLHAVQLDGATRDYAGSLRFEAFKRDARVLIRGIDFDIRRLK